MISNDFAKRTHTSIVSPAGKASIEAEIERDAYARSMPLGADAESWEIREVYEGELAMEIDKAIDWIDRTSVTSSTILGKWGSSFVVISTPVSPER